MILLFYLVSSKELMTKKHPEAELQGKVSSTNNPFARQRSRKITPA